MIESFAFDSGKKGPTLVILGAVHGNEHCGPIAINAFLGEHKEWKPQRGKVVFAPICNPRAYAEDVRFIDRNLNRSLYPKESKTAYEDHLDPYLCALLDQADILVDLHSYSSGDIPYAFIAGPIEKDIAFASSLGVGHLVYGFSEAYAASGHAVDPLENQGTTEYARLHGALSVTIECGFHTDPQSVAVAEKVIRNALIFAGMTNGDLEREESVALHKITRTLWKEKEGDFVKEWRNLDSIKKDEVLARYKDGTEIKAPEDGVILLVKPWQKPGGEWFCIGTSEPLS